jgi:hypothetical protein
LVLSLCKNETNHHFEHSSLSISSSLKNEIDSYEHSLLFVSSSLKNETNPQAQFTVGFELA